MLFSCVHYKDCVKTFFAIGLTVYKIYSNVGTGLKAE